MSGIGPSRRSRGSIKRHVHVRLDSSQAASLAVLEAATGKSAASVLLAAFENRQLPAQPKEPPKVLPAAADASVLMSIRQIGGLLGKGIRDRALPAPVAEKALNELMKILAIYERKINAAN